MLDPEMSSFDEDTGAWKVVFARYLDTGDENDS